MAFGPYNDFNEQVSEVSYPGMSGTHLSAPEGVKGCITCAGLEPQDRVARNSSKSKVCGLCDRLVLKQNRQLSMSLSCLSFLWYACREKFVQNIRKGQNISREF